LLSRADAIHHLLRIGLIAPAEVLDGAVTATEFFGRNHLIRVDRWSGCSFTIKQPRDVDAYDSMTMWTEAAIFWLSANDPEFERLARWMPRYFHYHEPDKVLTIEFVTGGDSLMAGLIAGTAPARLLAEVGSALATLHGPVSRATAAQPSRRLLGGHIPWVLTLGTPQMRYAAPNQVAASVLAEALRRPETLGGLARARAELRSDQIVHGDAKGANVLILDDGSIRLIDWEIAALGDGLWDLAGLVQSLLVPNPLAPLGPLAAMQARAAPWLESLCSGYWRLEGAPVRPPGWQETLLRLAGARLLQTCLESVHHADQVPPAVPSLLHVATELIARPQAAREAWRWAA
jgi:tRNA A-37 threonylcarbamoyl transferase component Bud32